MKNNKVIFGVLVVINIVLLIAISLTVWYIKNNSQNSKAEEREVIVTQSPLPEEDADLAEKTKPTIKKFLKTAMMPVGSTMYIYGGGWNKEDTGAGEYAVTIGVPAEWRAFYELQDSSYDSSKYRYQITRGLDCSGYVGWTVYNTLETENNREGYVFLAQEFSQRLNALGLGSNTDKVYVKDYKPGDIMSSDTDSHVWIVVGQCSDGSIVLLNSSPPGVSLCGTPSANGRTYSEAVALAERFMWQQFPEWYSKFPKCSKNISYLTNYNQFRWYLGEQGVLSDPDGYYNLTAEEVLNDIFSSLKGE